VAELAKEAGAFRAVVANHWAEGGAGATALGQAVIDACEESRKDTNSSFKFLYPLEGTTIKDKIASISTEIYGASSVSYSELAEQRIAQYTKLGYSTFPMCMAKTQYSLSTDAKAKGVPTNFNIHVRDIRVCVGAGYIYPICGDIMTIPGLPTRPGYYDVDIDTESGQIMGLF
jgi:methylenetetrahydrofolate dehydrogenase (NADP+) / methenyltetrahydrofolate cyclohydrolase / formyltetrahydrofolate synthetase